MKPSWSSWLDVPPTAFARSRMRAFARVRARSPAAFISPQLQASGHGLGVEGGVFPGFFVKRYTPAVQTGLYPWRFGVPMIHSMRD